MVKRNLHIVKVGGRVVEQAVQRKELVEKFAAIEGAKILVHGGGEQASNICKQLNIPVRMHQGRRITDKATMEVVTMVYAGLINKSVVADLQANRVNALGLSGADMNCVLANKRPVGEIDFGFAGDIEKIDSGVIDTLLKSNVSPVFCAITHNGKGQLLNTNADTIAAQLALAMSELYDVSLNFCLDREGVLDEQELVISELSQEMYQNLKSRQIIRDGMIPKLDNAFSVVLNCSAQVYICDLKNIGSSLGTQVLR